MTSLLQKIKALIASVNTKQDIITPGDNISIVNNVISSEVSQEDLDLKQDQLTVGDNITIASNVISLPSTINVSNINSTNFSSVDAIFSGIRRTPNQVFFLATRTTVQTPSTTSTLQFDKITTNIGGGYSNTTFQFTAPYDGTYLFFYSMVTNGNIQYQFDLRTIVGTTDTVKARQTRPGSASQGSMTITQTHALYLTSGTKVYLKLNSGSINLFIDPPCAFGGFLL